MQEVANKIIQFDAFIAFLYVKKIEFSILSVQILSLTERNL